MGFTVVGGVICQAIVFFIGGVYLHSKKVISTAVANGQCFYIKYVKWGWIPYEIGRTSLNCT